MGQVKLAGVRKSFGMIEVIKGVSLQVEQGEFIVFVGPSGCGKSTVLRMIAGLEDITHGSIEIDGRVVNDLPPVQRGISMVFQSYALYPHMNVYENIAFPLRVERLAGPEVEARVHRAADILQLHERLRHKPGQLSGGQRQRVAIGRAIVREPKVFLFDEPLSNLDAALRAEMRVELTRLHDELDATMIYVTHDQVEAMTMADRIVVLDAGLVAQVGSPLELYHKPENLFVAGFIGNPRMNFIDVTCTASTDQDVVVQLPSGNAVALPVNARPGLEGQKMKLGIRPEHVQVGQDDVQIATTPTVIERLGIHTVTYSEVDGNERPFCALLDGAVPAHVGEELCLGFAATDCHMFSADGLAFERRVPLSAIDPTQMVAGAEPVATH